MSDPLRTDAVRPPDRPDVDKEARIEQLLLSGLDRYFAGDYEQAVNIWTRVVFLERGHSRARAYIERARGALAERHREAEELLHRGIAAFNSGQTDAARDMITRAVERDGPNDVALVLLERLNRLATPAAVPDTARPVQPEWRAQPSAEATASERRSTRLRPAVVVALLLGGVAIATLTGMAIPAWFASSASQPTQQIAAVAPDPLPIARPSERLLARARELQMGGHVHDALRTLDAIDLADPVRQEANRLRAELQRQLLDVARTEASR